MSARAYDNKILSRNQYINLHRWVRRYLGAPNFCVSCKTTTAKTFEWANISQEYKKDLSDWQRMCRSCHRKFDYQFNKPTHCLRGHEFTDENIRIGSIGQRHCRACDKLRSHHAKTN